jgi:hypothetical protein
MPFGLLLGETAISPPGNLHIQDVPPIPSTLMEELAHYSDIRAASLLDADLEYRSERIGGVDAVHFAGHGEFDPARPDSSVLFLSDGLPLSSILFRSAKYGGPHQPLFFLNACMIGIGGQLLGDMGGFPGNCLKGGFGGVLGALWEIDDAAAAEIAIDFWKRAMPSGGKAGEPIGAILRDLRARYVTGGALPPKSTYLAYVYYGHPNLTLQRPD